MNMLAKLSYAEFEVLQLLVCDGDKTTEKLPGLLVLLKTSQITEAVQTLTQKKLIQNVQGTLSAQPSATEALEPYKVKRAVILAAGPGTRMQPETDTTPKAMVTVGDKRLIETQLDALIAADITDITVVRGYMGEIFDVLQNKYPTIRYLDDPYWGGGALTSTALAANLLGESYLIEGDLFIRDPSIIRPYEYRSSYCGYPDAVVNDWYFDVDGGGLIKQLSFGDSNKDVYRYVGISYLTANDANKLRPTLHVVTQSPAQYQGFVETTLFDTNAKDYQIYIRSVQPGSVTEIDTYKELLQLRARFSR